IAQFAHDQGVTYPILMDTTGEMLWAYGVSAFPTTFMIDARGNVFGYVPGSLPRDAVFDVIEQTLSASSAE
ncbi:MAG: TlpA family protein disulfide reductase, partial [Eggerthellaceae bacterium]|nr:TlpA family protein disulfide reductase [Eggerthellaceae bacterium]